jgi:hypothetical protein
VTRAIEKRATTGLAAALRAAAWVAHAWAAAPSIASATEPLRVIVLGDEGDPVARRLRDELQAAGMTVDLVADGGADPAALMRDRGAAALARPRSAPLEVRIWRRSSPDIDETVDVTSRGTGDEAARVLLLRAVEVLRGELMQVEARQTPAAPPASLPAPERASPDKPPPRPDAAEEAARRMAGWTVGLNAGPAVLVMTGGLPVVPQVRAGALFRIVDRVSIDVHVLVPTVASAMDEPEGTVGVRVLGSGAGPAVLFTEEVSPAVVSGVAGAGLSMIFFDGDAVSPYEDGGGVSAAATPYLALTAGYRFTPWIGLRADAQAGLLLPAQGLRAARREIGVVGPLTGSFSASLEVRP